MNINENKNFKELNTILNNLNLINLPSSLWGIHIHPKYEYIAVVHLSFLGTCLEIDRGIILQYNDITDKVEASIFLYSKNIQIPHIDSIISTSDDLCNVIFSVHNLKICTSWLDQYGANKNENCLIYVNPGYDKCLMCNNENNYDFQQTNTSKLSQIDSWQTEQLNDDVDVVVKQILELEYTEPVEPMKPEINIQSNVKIDDELKCRTCFKNFSTLSGLIRHERVHLQNTDNKVESVDKQANTENNCHRCTFCAKAFTNPSHLKVHLRKHSGERPFACDYCGKRFFTKSHVKEHIRLHTGERPYSCPICNKTNSHRSAHQRHVLTHSKLKTNLCNICGKTFCKGYRMEDHLATHATEKPYKCELCHKSFAKPTSLKIHRKTHTGARPHVCNICGKRYTTQSNLGTHMKSHTGTKPYGCGVCPARFVHPRQLRLHQRVHTGEKPYACPDCGRAFAKNVHLTVHRRIHTGEKPYVCPEPTCGRRFTTSGNMNAHRKVHHSNLNANINQGQ